MRGERIANLKTAFEVLTGLNTQGTAARYARFQNREHVMLLTFANEPGYPMRFNFENESAKPRTESNLRAYVESLSAGGGILIALLYVATGESRRAVYEESIEHIAACSNRGGSAQSPQEAVVRKFLSE